MHHPVSYGCNPFLSFPPGNAFYNPVLSLKWGHSVQASQSGSASVLANPSHPIGIISKAEVLIDPAGVLTTGVEAYRHQSLTTQTPIRIWSLESGQASPFDGFKPKHDNNSKQVIKIHSAVVESGSPLTYTATNSTSYDNVQDIAAVYGFPMVGLGGQKWYTSSGLTPAFNSINDFYNTHGVLENDSFFFETIVYADELVDCNII